MLISMIVLISFQCIPTSKHQIVCLKYIQLWYVNYSSIKLWEGSPRLFYRNRIFLDQIKLSLIIQFLQTPRSNCFPSVYCASDHHLCYLRPTVFPYPFISIPLPFSQEWWLLWGLCCNRLGCEGNSLSLIFI